MFGRIPGPTLWVFESLGLAGFVAVVGLNAGPDFVQGLRTSGVSLVVAGALTVSIALLIGVLVGGGGAVVASKGDDVELPAGTVVNLRLERPVAVR